MLCKVVLPSKDIFRLPSLPKTYEELCTFIRARFSEASPDNIIIKYMDSDNELITLDNDEDLQTAVLTSQLEQMGTLKVFVFTKEVSSNNSMTNELINSSTEAEHPLKKTLEDREICLIQSQYFDDMESLTSKNSKTVREQDSSMLSEGHLDADTLSNFLEKSIGHAIDENLRDLFSRITGTFGPQKKNQESHVLLRKEIGWMQNLSSGFACVECKRQIKDIEYICLNCLNYRSCEECENRGVHLHPLLKFRVTSAGRVSLQSKNTLGKKSPFSGKITFGNSEKQVLKIKTLPYQEHQITLVLQNTGTNFWPKKVSLRCVNGNYINRQEDLISLDPGSKQIVHLDITAPEQAGRHLSQWKIYYENGEAYGSFGESLFIEVYVRYKKDQYNEIHKRTELTRQSTNAKEKNNALIKRTGIFNAIGYNDFEEETKKNYDEEVYKERILAEYLNEIFPGCLEEKYKFVKKYSRNIDANDFFRIVEIYLQNLYPIQNQKLHKESRAITDKESCYTLI